MSNNESDDTKVGNSASSQPNDDLGQDYQVSGINIKRDNAFPVQSLKPNELTDNNDKCDDNGENKRQRHIPTNANISNSINPAFGASPPNFISFEEIMKTANEISRMALVNEIVLNKDFKIEKKKEDTSNPFEKAVRDNMQKAFWDILTEQLAESPPNYKQAIILINEIKEALLAFLMPQHVQLKNEINEILDIDLIRQQAENGIFESQRYAQYVLSVCSRLCCPARDEMIRNLTQTTDIIPLFKGIFELLEMMHMDFANFYIQQFRPHIQLASVEYERDKFKQLIESHQKYQIDVLEYTTAWLRRNYQSLDLVQETDLKNIFNKILTTSYIDLVKCISPSFNCYSGIKDESSSSSSTHEDDYPETLLLIRQRIDNIREQVYNVTLISSVFVVTFAAIGEPLQSVKEFRLELKKQLDSIISSPDDKPLRLQTSTTDEIKSILVSVALQVIKSIEEALQKYDVDPASGIKTLDDKKLESLKYQINELATASNRIRSLMERRILEFIERVISSSTAVPIQVPTGLSSFSAELTKIAGEYTRLVAYNRAVYSPYYTKIIADIASPTHFISPSELKEIEKTFYG